MADKTNTFLDRTGRWLARRLQRETSGYKPFTASDPVTLYACLQPGDIVLIEGNQKLSAAIKYLTQSTWSHAAMFVGDTLPEVPDRERNRLIEVNLGEGCVGSPLSKYATYNTRICRPVGLAPSDRDHLVSFMTERIGIKYDLRNIFDLIRYLLPTPPVPTRWRRRMIALGSSSPTRAICSTLIAQAFQSIQYPILPAIHPHEGETGSRNFYSRREILHIRHHSLFTPRDFDVSPYFQIIKPTVEKGFDFRDLNWASRDPDLADPR